MGRISPFGDFTSRYDAWLEEHQVAHVAGLLALRVFVPHFGRGLETGVVTGRFASPLGVVARVDPSPALLELAAARGIQCVEGVAEELPFADAGFDYVLTTICFVDRESAIGREYQARRAESAFYRDATFHSAEEVEHLLRDAGFSILEWG